MHKKKYQVFISSTYSDLKSERDAVTKALYEMGCIPVGMEAFPAADEEQFNFIKRIIDDTDYYILLIGARYGSLADDGLGFTEKEYDYASEKGVPILAFVHSDPSSINGSKTDLGNPKIAEKFYRFRNSVTKNRLVKMWDDSSTLAAYVVLALNTAIADRPRPGWSRGMGVDNEEILSQLVKTQNELRDAKSELERVMRSQAVGDDIADLSVALNLEVEAWRRNYQSSLIKDSPINTTVQLKKLFRMLGPNIIEPLYQDRVSNILAIEATNGLRDQNAEPAKFRLERESLNTVRLQLDALGLIKVERGQAVNNQVYNYWSLTQKGLDEVKRLRVIKKDPPVGDEPNE